MTRIFSLIVLFGVMWAGCEKEAPNPYKDFQPNNQDTVALYKPDPKSFAGLHAYIFKPTCANSGCHDGTFEPDFRTISSTYNTLVYHPIIKNDPQNSFTYRVKPGSSAESVLYKRLTADIDGQSGIMPLVVDPGSDWNSKKDEYIANIKAWVDGGAKDIFGNLPSLTNKVPQMQGVLGKTGTWLDRADSGQGALRVKETETSLDLYFAFSDDKTPSDQLTNARIKFSKSQDDFANATSFPLEVLSTPVDFTGYYGNNVHYYHKYSLNPQNYAKTGETIFFRVYVTDSDGIETEIPTNDGVYYIKNYFSFKIIIG